MFKTWLFFVNLVDSWLFLDKTWLFFRYQYTWWYHRAGCTTTAKTNDLEFGPGAEPGTWDSDLLVGYHGEPKVNLFHNVRII